MVEFRKRKSDGQSFPLGTAKKIRANNPSNQVGGLRIGKGVKTPKTVQLENRANVGIRAYTDQVSFEGVPVVFEIGTHVVIGKYLIEPYWENGGTAPNPDIGAPEFPEGFDTFQDAVDFLEDKVGINIVLDRDRSNDHQTWEENIEQTDRILPIESVFWKLPEPQRNKIGSEGHEGESIEEFLIRKGIEF